MIMMMMIMMIIVIDQVGEIKLEGGGGQGGGAAPAAAPSPSPVAPPSNASSNGDEVEKEPTPAEQSILQKILRTKLVENKQKLEVIRKDPTSPLFSATSFEELPL
jgi:ATP-dependent RNA helicase DDX19/DBP5